MKILLIDDDRDDQVLFKEALNHITDQIECETLDNGMQALQVLTNSEVLPDVLFLDMNMPRMDGKETLHAIRANPKLTTLDVVMYSTSNSETDMNWARTLNARYLVKQNSFLALITSLKTTLHETLDHRNNKQIIWQTC